MASRSPPDDSTPTWQGPYSEPRSWRWPPRQQSASLDADLSLAAEVQRAEGEVSQRSLLNNLGWSFTTGSQASSSKKSAAKKKGKHFEQVKLPSKAISDSPPAVPFAKKRHHTPATIPRTRLPPGTPASERLAMSSLRQQLFYEDAEDTSQKTTRASHQSSLSTANNERCLPAQSRTQTSSNLPVLETNETDSRQLATTDGGIKSGNTPLIISRLTQVRDFLKQATAMFATLQSSGVSELRSSELSEQAIKIARLIKQLKEQEQAYVELLQRSVAVEHDSTLENTPSLSLQSLTEEEKSESTSIRDEELQGLRQQHALLKKMLDQQQQLKELQTRQAALLTLQRDAEIRLAEAEEEGRQVTSDVGAEGGAECEPRRSRGGTETVQDLQLSTTETQRNGVRDGPSILDDSRFTPQEQELMNLLRRHKERWRAADSEDEKDKDERENHQRPKKKNQLSSTTMHSGIPVPSLDVADNEEAALALANATQERLELENKLMVLEAKKEQMDTLLQELQSLREAQLRKESLEAAGGAISSVNESKQEEDEPLATTSQKLDDERILEALEVHEKLQKLQEVRDRLKQLRDLIGHYQPDANGPNVPENGTCAVPAREHVEITGELAEHEGAVGGAAAPLTTSAVANAVTDQEFNSIEWMLSAGIDDPDLFGKIRQLQEARERVAHLFKQTNENTQASISLANNEGGMRASVQTQTTEEESDAETQTETDAESAFSGGSSSVNTLAWQDDPEFQANVRKLNSAKQKLKQLQELVKKIQQFPESSLTLPAELAELSFDEDDYAEENENNDDDDDDDDDDEGEEEEGDEEDDDEDQNESNSSEASNENNVADTRITEDGFTGDNTGSDQEAVYQWYLQKQTETLEQLQQERQRLFKVQGELSRLTQHYDALKTVATQTPKIIPQKSEAEEERTTRSATCTTDRTGVSKNPAAQNPLQQERSTQTPFYGSSLREARSIDSNEPQRARPSALVWSELRRQRELHEEKLKKRKQKFLEKRKKAGLDDVSEGGTYSVRSGRSGDMDEGFGVSMMSADITTATWGGSTQPSSTQNDSAVSADESDEENQAGEIPVEVEDEYPDGIVQAEEEEEQRLEQETFSGGPEAVFRSRERVPRLSAFRESIDGTAQPSSGKKRKLDGTALSGGVRKRDGERGLTFQDWPRTFYFDRNSRGRIRQENFTSADQLIKEREQEQFNVERQVWEQHCEQLHQEVSNLTSLCNGLLRDQQLLVSTIINRGAGTSPSPNAGLHNFPGRVSGLGGNPFEQYQQRQQEAYQGLQSFFDQQRYLQQQYQMLQNLNQCYLQLQQQHQDMAFLQQQFQQLFSHNVTSPQRPQTVTPSAPASLYPSFCSLPSQSSASQSFPLQPPLSAPLFSQSPFTSSIQQPSSAHVSAKTTWAPTFGQALGENSLPTNIEALPTTQAADKYHPFGSVNPGTGVPSQRTASYQGNPVEHAVLPSTSGVVKPLVVREAGASKEDAGLVTTTTIPDQTYNPTSYTETATTNVSAAQVGETTDVIGRTFPTPLRASAVASLAKKDKSTKNPAGFDLARNLGVESVETSSKASSVPGDGRDVAKISWQEADRASEAGSEFSLFEALRDSIYSEVATLISLNESRPHFLLELFRELQLLTSDYLRQRALYALQDLVTRFLTEDSLGAEGASLQQARFQEWLGSNSELTPSETVETFEDEVEVKENAVPAETLTEGIYDYVENVESGSTLSTPTSSHTGETPFASEGLGDTVIHLDQALSRMREYERLRTEGRLSEVVCSSSPAKDKSTKDDVTTSSAGDVGSESSISDVQYPRINTQALDHLIKSIMSEVIPYLNEHMEDSCTSELLGYVRNLVLSRIQVNEEQEFGRFFHKQLATILQDSLARFTDRKMKDCGEDMLVDMSEILFNELAFFRLMQDLDGTRGASGRPRWRQGYASSTDTGTGQEGDKEDGEESEDKDEQQPEDSAVEEEGGGAAADVAAAAAVAATVEREEAEDEEEEEEDSSNESSSEESGAEDEGADDERQEGEEEDALPISKEEQEAEEEELGKARDDVMASQFEERTSRLPGNNSLESPQCVKLELSASEFKPFSSTGSGEEDGEESFDDSEARQKLDEYVEGTAAAANKDPPAVRGSGNSESGDNDNDDRAPQDEQRQAVEAAAEAASATGVSSYLHNGQVGNSHDHTEVTLDDLPTKLTGLTEADLQARIAEEQRRTEGSPAVLAHIDGLQELAGDSESLREPDSSERPMNGVEYDLHK